MWLNFMPLHKLLCFTWNQPWSSEPLAVENTDAEGGSSGPSHSRLSFLLLRSVTWLLCSPGLTYIVHLNVWNPQLVCRPKVWHGSVNDHFYYFVHGYFTRAFIWRLKFWTSLKSTVLNPKFHSHFHFKGFILFLMRWFLVSHEFK